MTGSGRCWPPQGSPPAWTTGILTRLRRLNVSLGWDHASQVDLPLARLGEPPVRAALWSALFAGGHARLESPPLGPDRWRRPAPSWEPGPFLEFWGP